MRILAPNVTQTRGFYWVFFSILHPLGFVDDKLEYSNDPCRSSNIDLLSLRELCLRINYSMVKKKFSFKFTCRDLGVWYLDTAQ